jgi:hypothetical protein
VVNFTNFLLRHVSLSSLSRQMCGSQCDMYSCQVSLPNDPSWPRWQQYSPYVPTSSTIFIGNQLHLQDNLLNPLQLPVHSMADNIYSPQFCFSLFYPGQQQQQPELASPIDQVMKQYKLNADQIRSPISTGEMADSMMGTQEPSRTSTYINLSQRVSLTTQLGWDQLQQQYYNTTLTHGISFLYFLPCSYSCLEKDPIQTCTRMPLSSLATYYHPQHHLSSVSSSSSMTTGTTSSLGLPAFPTYLMPQLSATDSKAGRKDMVPRFEEPVNRKLDDSSFCLEECFPKNIRNIFPCPLSHQCLSQIHAYPEQSIYSNWNW